MNHCGSYIHSPDWMKNKKATISPINKKDNKCFQYGVTVVLNCDKIGKNSEIIIKIEFLSVTITGKKQIFHEEKMIGKKQKKKNKKVVITLNVLHAKNEEPYSVYVSKHNSNLEEQIILLIIPKGEGIILQ